MKRRSLLIIGALAFSSIIGLTSCNNESPIIDKVDEIIEDATLELDYNSEYVDVSVIQSDEKIYSGKEIKLEVKVKDPLNYAFVYATLNNEKIEDLNKILLVKGTNVIKIYVKSIFVQEGTTNLRDFTFVKKSDGTYKITGYTPSGLVPTRLEIPSTYLGKEVNEIAFDYNLITGNVESQYSFSAISQIYIPKTIKNISSEVFLYGESVEEFIVDESNPVYGAIEKCLFDKVNMFLISAPRVFEGTFNIPKGTLGIENYAFYRVLNLTDIKFNDELLMIGSRSFYGCSNIKNFTLSNNITTIGSEAFAYCSKLKSITLSSKLESLERQVFNSCIKLESIVIPGSVKYIKEFAFASCNSLETVILNEGLKTIEQKAFQYTPIKSLVLPSTLKTIGDNAFGACEYLTSVTVNEGLEKIGKTCFNLCKKLEEFSIPSTLTSIGEGAFTACISLKNINVSETNTSYMSKDGVLYSKDGKTLIHYPNLANFKRYEIPSGTTTLGFRCFNYVSNNPYAASSTLFSVEEIVIPKSVTKMINPFYGANRVSIIYEGTKEEFDSIETSATIDGETVSWNTGSMISSVTCSDGVLTA
ncbi:MAG: leucine-rich repeat protein [Candidatus Onthovivens sp.]|nr:leucine-rich repeat protein [Candidatus Onthovivens sp.]